MCSTIFTSNVAKAVIFHTLYIITFTILRFTPRKKSAFCSMIAFLFLSFFQHCAMCNVQYAVQIDVYCSIVCICESYSFFSILIHSSFRREKKKEFTFHNIIKSLFSHYYKKISYDNYTYCVQLSDNLPKCFFKC